MKKFLAVMGWMLVIFILSSQTETISNLNSKAVVDFMLRAVGHITKDGAAAISPEGLEVLNLVLRKISHALAYFILAILIMVLTDRGHIKGYKAILLSFAVCAVYAVSDEIHQWFVPGRTSSVVDVFIDCGGAVLGIVLYMKVIRATSGRGTG